MTNIHSADPVFIDDLEEDILHDREHITFLLKNRVESEDFNLFALGDRALSLCGRLNRIGQGSTLEFKGMLQLASHSYCSAIYLSNYPYHEKELEIGLIGHPETFSRLSIGPNSMVYSGSWIKAFYLALANGDLNDIENPLCVTTLAILQASSTKPLPFRDLHFEALKAVFLGSPDRHDRMSALIDAVSFDKAKPIDQEYLLDIGSPEVALLAAFVMQDTDLFNSQLEAVLRGHRHYFDRDGTAYTPDSHVRNAPQEWICLPAMAFASWARMSGIPVQVESPYMPLPATYR